MFFGDDLSAADAERLGIVNKVVPAAELEATAREWAERLAQGPTKTIGYAKRLLNRSLDVDRATMFEAGVAARRGRHVDRRLRRRRRPASASAAATEFKGY